MKKVFYFFMLNITLMESSFSKNMVTINGFSDLKNGVYDSLIVNGKLVCDALTIQDVLIVNGNTRGRHLKCQNIKSNGSFIGQNIEVTGQAEFNGNLEIGKIQQCPNGKHKGDCFKNTSQWPHPYEKSDQRKKLAAIPSIASFNIKR